MAASVTATSKKVVLNLVEGTQTISPILNSATEEAIYATGNAVGALLNSRVEAVQLVVTETIEG